MKIIAGLGNPGEKYNNTRHNAGFMVLNKIAENNNLKWQVNKKFNSQTAKLGDTLLVKPLTYMNNSGQALQAVLSYYKLLPKKLGLVRLNNCDLTDILTVIHDDMDIDLGKFKMSDNSRSAGQKGVGSIINHLKTKNFIRYRVGIKTPRQINIPAEKYVLSNFNKEERELIDNLIKTLITELAL